MSDHKSQSSYSHILKYTGLFGSVQVICILINLVRTKIIALLLGPIGVGVISLYNSTMKFVGDFTNLGISVSAVKEMSLAHERGDEIERNRLASCVRTWCLIAALLGLVICISFRRTINYLAFGHEDHTFDFVLLSPVVALMALTGGEMAILKGMRRLGQLAKTTLWSTIVALIVSLPVYLYYGLQGIIPAILLITLIQFLITFYFSSQHIPYRLSFLGDQLKEGFSFVKLGMAFVLATSVASGADFFIRAYISRSAQVDVLGLYNAGLLVSVVYAGTIFSSMENDYYPRLSAVKRLGIALNGVVNRQIEISLLLAAPMIILLVWAMPLIIPLLFSRHFEPVIPMARIASLAMIFRAIYLPLEYISLSRGHSYKYFIQEDVSALLMIVCIVGGFSINGLIGAGYGVTLAAILETLFMYTFVRMNYEYRPSYDIFKYAGSQILLSLLVYLLILIDNQLLYWLLGAVLFSVSLILSYRAIKAKSALNFTSHHDSKPDPKN